MIIVTVSFPDERVDWIDHLHASFPDQMTADRWLRGLESLGKMEHAQASVPAYWKCPICGVSPGKVRRPMAAVGRDGGLLDIE